MDSKFVRVLQNRSVLLFLVFIEILFIFFHKEIFENTIIVNVYLQSSTESLVFRKFLSFISFFFEEKCLIFTALTLMNFLSVNLYLRTVMIVFFLHVSIALMKGFLRDPRPYYFLEEVKAYSCSSGYGNPSGHSFMSTILLLYYYFIYLKNAGSKMSKFKRKFILFTFLSTISIICFSRIYLGVHSLDQVLNGFFLGTIIVMIFIQNEKFIESQIEALRKGGRTREFFCGLISIIMIMLMIDYIFLHPSNENNIVKEDDPMMIRLYQKCKRFHILLLFHNHSFINFCHLPAYFYHIFAVHLASKHDPIQIEEFENSPVFIKFIRFLFLIGIGGSFYVPILFFPMNDAVQAGFYQLNGANMMCGIFLYFFLKYSFLFNKTFEALCNKTNGKPKLKITKH